MGLTGEHSQTRSSKKPTKQLVGFFFFAGSRAPPRIAVEAGVPHEHMHRPWQQRVEAQRSERGATEWAGGLRFMLPGMFVHRVLRVAARAASGCDG